ncbi:MAG: 50S ribosomal protein L24 [Candidatus Gracilibacteria bacterium]|jgi:large subunit ribosomal protein L24|nr:50S ribosomal protein L24 [Candidatus Gracilibacteria bacterium]
MTVKTEDNVIVLAGKDKGKQGKVIKVDRKNECVVVEKVNIIKKHIKKQQGQPGQRVEMEAPINASNVQVVCPSCKKPTRIGMQVSKTGKKVRTCKKCSSSLEKNFVKN